MKEEQHNWYEKAFGELYPLIYSHRDDRSALEEARDMVALLGLSSAPLRVLDLCCGGGRHAAALAQMGFNVTGLDLSGHLLGRAVQRRVLGGRLVRADMRQLPFGEKMDLVLNLFTSFGYFSSDKENRSVVCEMFRVLVPEGRVLIDHINAAAVRNSVGTREEKMGDLLVRQESRVEGNRVKKDITVSGQETFHIKEDVRLYRPEEMQRMLREASFDNIALYGGLDGSALNKDSRRMICTAQKPRGVQ